MSKNIDENKTKKNITSYTASPLFLTSSLPDIFGAILNLNGNHWLHPLVATYFIIPFIDNIVRSLAYLAVYFHNPIYWQYLLTAGLLPSYSSEEIGTRYLMTIA